MYLKILAVSFALFQWTACQGNVACPQENATSFALTYGIPLLAYEQSYLALSKASVSANMPWPTTTIAGPQQTAYVRPNVDTLTTLVHHDLSAQDLEVTVPDIPDGRYWSVAFYDPYGDNYLNLSPINHSEAGPYILTVAQSVGDVGTLAKDDQGYKGTIYAPQTFGIILLRVVLLDPVSDISLAQGYQSQFQTTVIPRQEHHQGPALTGDLFSTSSNVTGQHILELTARFTETLPGSKFSSILPNVTAELESAGIGNETYSKPTCVDISSTYAEVASQVTAFDQQPSNRVDLGNDWFLQSPDLVGDYGVHYEARAFLSVLGYLAMVSTQAVYPKYTGNLSLASNESYTFSFAGKPPLTKTGFWSLTMYSATGYLVANSISRYSIGDRSRLIYSDGTPIYGSNASNQRDGPFQILVQAQPPPDNWTSNWLPSPPEPGPFTVLLRYYAGREGLVNGSYIYPLVTKGPAVLPSNSPTTTLQSSESSSIAKPSTYSSSTRKIYVTALVAVVGAICWAFLVACQR